MSATVNPVNDAALAAQLEITRDAAIANLQTKTEEVRQQYQDEASRIAAQKQQTAEVAQASLDAYKDNAALRAEADYNQAFKNLQAAGELAERYAAANPREVRQPLEIHRQVAQSTQEFLKAQENYVATHPDKADDPGFNLRLMEDENGGFRFSTETPGLAEQSAIAGDPRNLSLADLRLAAQKPQKQNQQADPNAPLASFVDNPDGTFDMVLATGETYKGFKATENRDAIRKLGESKVNTRRHYESLLAQQQQTNVQQQPMNGQQPTPANDPALTANTSLSDWFTQQALEGIAQKFGYANGAEFIADQTARYQRDQQNGAILEDYRNRVLAGEFLAQHPEYPNTDAANSALEQIINRNGWEWTPDTMAAAHALAVQNRIYQPLSQEEIAVANGYEAPQQRHTPPPMPPTGSPEMSQPVQDPRTMPLDELRKKILAGQMGGR